MDIPKLLTQVEEDVAILRLSFRVYSVSDEVDN